MFKSLYALSWGFLGGAVAKNLPANAGDMVPSLSQEDPVQKEMATHTSILAWETPWTEEPGRLQSMGFAKSRTQLSNFSFLPHSGLIVREKSESPSRPS